MNFLFNQYAPTTDRNQKVRTNILNDLTVNVAYDTNINQDTLLQLEFAIQCWRPQLFFTHNWRPMPACSWTYLAEGNFFSPELAFR